MFAVVNGQGQSIYIMKTSNHKYQGSFSGDWTVKHLPEYHGICLGISLGNNHQALSSDYQRVI